MNALRRHLGTAPSFVATALFVSTVSVAALAETAPPATTAAPPAPAETAPVATTAAPPAPVPAANEPASPEPAAPEPASPEPAAPPAVQPDASPLPEQNPLNASSDLLAPLTWNEQSGQGVSFAYESGLWGGWWGQGVRVGVPFGRHFAVHLRGLYVSDTSIEEDVPYTADVGGRLDFIGRSQPFLNLVRLYGGGGMQVFEPVFATEGRSTQVGGGGHFGFEFFCNPNFSFFLEVGGQGGKPAAGATVLAGMAFYPWTH